MEWVGEEMWQQRPFKPVSVRKACKRWAASNADDRGLLGCTLCFARFSLERSLARSQVLPERWQQEDKATQRVKRRVGESERGRTLFGQARRRGHAPSERPSMLSRRHAVE